MTILCQMSVYNISFIIYHIFKRTISLLIVYIINLELNVIQLATHLTVMLMTYRTGRESPLFSVQYFVANVTNVSLSSVRESRCHVPPKGNSNA